jgi:hypothetical protein
MVDNTATRSKQTLPQFLERVGCALLVASWGILLVLVGGLCRQSSCYIFLDFRVLMANRVKLFILEDEDSEPDLVGPLNPKNISNYREMRGFLTKTSIIVGPFNFWDLESRCRIAVTLEEFNDLLDEIYVIRVGDAENPPSKHRRVEAIGETNVAVPEPPPVVEEVIEFVFTEEETPLAQGSRVTRNTDLFIYDFKSLLLSKELEAKYVAAAKTLQKELDNDLYNNQVWHLKSWDSDGMAVVKMWCGECGKDFGGTSNNQSSLAICNLFTNFKKSHLKTSTHIRNWCRKRGKDYNDHKKGSSSAKKSTTMSRLQQKQAIEVGLENVKIVNASVEEGDPFVVIGNPKDEDMKAEWFKVCCKVCGDLFLLCPQHNNLVANLENHVNGLKHARAVEDVAHSVVSSGKRGRPQSLSKGIKGAQLDLHSWFKNSSSGRTSSDSGTSPRESDSILSLLCWGYWFKNTSYGNKWYSVVGLLNDAKPGCNWNP